MKSLLLIFTVGLTLLACSKQTDDVYKEIDLTLKSNAIVQADNDFGLDLFSRVEQDEEEVNLMLSPLSISMALTMAYNGAETETKAQMAEALKVDDFSKEELNETYKTLIKALIEADPRVALAIANSIWYRDTYPVVQDYLDVNNIYFNAEVNPADFNDPQTLKAINKWVDDNTNGKIDKIIDEIPAEMVMYLINAIYFKGTWSQEFNPESTEQMSFYPSDGEAVQTDMMSREDTLNYVKTDDFSAIELPYGGGNFNMVVLLPDNNKTIGDISGQLNAENWIQWMDDMKVTENIDIRLPKFKVEYEITLNDVLKSMGMEQAFTSQADFSSINPARNLFISFVKHKSSIEVNEEGTEAAAVTSIGFEVTSFDPNKPQKIHFHCTRPFLFAITEKETGAILFIGKIGNPEA